MSEQIPEKHPVDQEKALFIGNFLFENFVDRKGRFPIGPKAGREMEEQLQETYRLQYGEELDHLTRGEGMDIARDLFTRQQEFKQPRPQRLGTIVYGLLRRQHGR